LKAYPGNQHNTRTVGNYLRRNGLSNQTVDKNSGAWQ